MAYFQMLNSFRVDNEAFVNLTDHLYYWSYTRIVDGLVESGAEIMPNRLSKKRAAFSSAHYQKRVLMSWVVFHCCWSSLLVLLGFVQKPCAVDKPWNIKLLHASL